MHVLFLLPLLLVNPIEHRVTVCLHSLSGNSTSIPIYLTLKVTIVPLFAGPSRGA